MDGIKKQKRGKHSNIYLNVNGDQLESEDCPKIDHAEKTRDET